MPSPFPGMNPYLENADIWQDFHNRFIPDLAEALTPQADPKYFVKIEDQLYVHEPATDTRQRVGSSDVSIRPEPVPGPTVGNTTLLEAPARVNLPSVDVERIARVEIRTRNNRQLITVI